MKLLSKNKIVAIGLMSGTSLDGLDLVASEFSFSGKSWQYKILAAETIPYSSVWTEKLKNGHLLSGEQLIGLHVEYGKLLGKETKKFIQKTGIVTDLIASHGHTLFHQPENQFTFQAGSGFEIAAKTGITTVADFRTGDVALGGQGAPLVPVGDKFLFGEYKFCLNLGGFANISFDQDNRRIAFDICPVNFVLNHLSAKAGQAFDKNGELGRSGLVHLDLLEELNSLKYYNLNPPKSLGREWVEENFFPVLDRYEISLTDKMRTVYEHVALHIASVANEKAEMLVTGGGTFNSFLVERITALSKSVLAIPSNELINYKEAFIFAFLGVLRVLNMNNCLSSVTGASRDHCSGLIFQA